MWERPSNWFGSSWWGNNDKILIFVWIIPLSNIWVMVNKNERHLSCITWVFRRLYFPSLLHNKAPIPFSTLQMHCFLQALWILRKRFSLCWITLIFIALNMSLKSFFPNHPGFRGKPLFLLQSLFSQRKGRSGSVLNILTHLESAWGEDSFKYGDKWLFYCLRRDYQTQSCSEYTATVWHAYKKSGAVRNFDVIWTTEDDTIFCENVFAADYNTMYFDNRGFDGRVLIEHNSHHCHLHPNIHMRTSVNSTSCETSKS